MKTYSILCASAIAASTLNAFSSSALAISHQPRNITANIELQSSQISEHPPTKISQVRRGSCVVNVPCGWW